MGTQHFSHWTIREVSPGEFYDWTGPLPFWIYFKRQIRGNLCYWGKSLKATGKSNLMIPRSLVEKWEVGESSQFLEADTRFNFFFLLQPYLGCQTVTDSRLRQSHVALCSDPGAVSQSACHVMGSPHGLSSSLRKSQDACGPPPIPGLSLKFTGKSLDSELLIFLHPG